MKFLKKLVGGSSGKYPDGYDFYLVKDDVQETTTVHPSGATLTETGGYRLIPQTYDAFSWCDHNNISSKTVMVDGVFFTKRQLPGLLNLLSEEELSVFEVKS